MENQQSAKCKCPFCSEEISVWARKCRFCGEWMEASERENRKKVNSDDNDNDNKSLIAVVLILIMFAFAFFALTSGGDKNTSNQIQEAKTEKKDDGKSHNFEAWACAQIKIEGMLKSPKSADFEFGGGTNSTTALGNENYEINSYVDAGNSFGAEIRQKFECSVKYKAESDSCETYCKFL